MIFIRIVDQEERVMRITVVMAVLMCLAAFSDARAEFYRWVDRDGREFYTNEKEKIPAEYRNAAKPVEVRDDRVSVGSGPAPDGAKSAKVAEHKDKYGRGEQYWHKRAEDLRRKIRDQETEREFLVKQEKDDEADPKKSASSAKKARSSRDKKKATIDKKIAKLKHELEVELPEEARKADAYPGWIRE
jgi:vacuolar-type H+-ATPase subunit I/STV1